MTAITLSPKALFVRFGLLSSTLSVILAVSACQDSVVSNEQTAQESENTVNSEINNSAITLDTIPVNIEAGADEMSVEEAMINDFSRYRWTLTSATDNKAQPLSTLMAIKDQVMLSFNHYQGQNTLSYSVGCNTISAAYQLQGSTLTIEDSMSTKMSCGTLDMAENSLSELMQGDSQLVLMENDTSEEDKPILTQVTSGNATLVWDGKLTAQAKYNSKGETVFWAVNAKMTPCKEGSLQMCLQVKPITYDDQGIKTSEGEWAPFAGVIDGYQHDDKHDEVLRLQRYQLADSQMIEDATGNASDEPYAYVLDAVIESSVVALE